MIFLTSPTLLIKLICRGTASKMHIFENNYWAFGRLATLVVKMQSEISAFRQNQGTHQWIVIFVILSLELKKKSATINDEWFIAHGSRFMAHASRLVSQGSWLMA